MDIAMGIVVAALWMLAVAACTDLGWQMRPVRAAMLFVITAEFRLNAIIEELNGRIAARRNG